MSFETVLVVDFGAQYAQLIARRVREANVFSQIVPHDMPASEMMALNPVAIILSGGPESVYAEGAPGLDQAILTSGIPILGICYGAQLIAQLLGGEVRRTEHREYGPIGLRPYRASSMLINNRPFTVWMSHGDSIVTVPMGFKPTARTEHVPVASFENSRRKIYGVQFHPEVAHTEHGQLLIERFLTDAGCAFDWTPTSVVEETVAALKQQIGDAPVVCGLSGGVDSAVAAALVHNAVGHQLTCIYVDNGLMRTGETEQVVEAFEKHFGIRLLAIDAGKQFLDALNDIADPERKRKIIGETFFKVFWEAAMPLGARFLVQGTLYPDVIESGPGKAATIKTHHNLVALPEGVEFEFVEPLRNMFKDEVRVVGEELGLPEEIVWRQPFPGPGLGIRIIGTITPERLEMLRAADQIFLEEIRAAGLYQKLWQSFAVLPVVNSVGVMGDERTYGHPIVLRAVTSEDAMTADWAELPRELITKVTSRIIGEVPGINRIVQDVTPKPPGTIEWE